MYEPIIRTRIDAATANVVRVDGGEYVDLPVPEGVEAGAVIATPSGNAGHVFEQDGPSVPVGVVRIVATGSIDGTEVVAWPQYSASA